MSKQIPVVQECSRPTVECPDPQLWRMYDGMSAEVEVLDFIAQLVKTIKPQLVVETGAFAGLSAVYIGHALKANGRGKLITCEIDPKLYQVSIRRIEAAGLSDVVEIRQQSSLDMAVEGKIDLLFADSEPSIRMDEIRHFSGSLSPRAVILVHDVNSGCHKLLRDKVLSVDEERELSVVMLPTPRGLAICQKRQERK